MTPGQPVIIRGVVEHAVTPDSDVCIAVPSGHLWVSPKDVSIDGEPRAADRPAVTAEMAEFAGRVAFHDYLTVSAADPALVPSILPADLAAAFRAGFEEERGRLWPEWPAPTAPVLADDR